MLIRRLEGRSVVRPIPLDTATKEAWPPCQGRTPRVTSAVDSLSSIVQRRGESDVVI
jgi:hypothetical protein